MAVVIVISRKFHQLHFLFLYLSFLRVIKRMKNFFLDLVSMKDAFSYLYEAQVDAIETKGELVQTLDIVKLLS